MENNNINDLLSQIGKSKEKIQSNWSKEDFALFDWLFQSELNEFISILGVIADCWNNDVCTNNFFNITREKLNKNLTESEKIVGALIIVHEIRQYSGYSFWPSKPPYEKTLTKVHKRIGKHFKKNVPEISSVKNREESVTTLMVGEAINNLTSEELDSALSGCDLPKNLTFEKRKKILLQTLAAGGFKGLVSLVGKNVIKKAVLAIIEKFIKKKAGEKAIKEVLEKIAKKIPAKTFEKIFIWAGWALLIKDIIDIGGEATRVTTPLVTAISVSRSLSRASNS